MNEIDESAPLFAGRHALCVPGDSETELAFFCDLSLSLVTVPPELIATADGGVGALQYPVTIAGQYSQTPVPHTLRSLTRRAEDVLFALESVPLPDTATRLVSIETACRHLFDAFAPVVRTAIQWTLQHLFSDQDLIEWYAQKYAADNSDVSIADVEHLCDRIADASQRPYPAPKFGGILTGIKQEYTDHVARLVARLALSPPVQTTSDGLPVAQQNQDIDLTQRARRLAETVDRIFDTTADIDSTQLQTLLIEESDVPVTLQQDEAKESSLLALPHEEATAKRESRGTLRAELIGYPSGLAWLLDKTFTDGGFGGAVYTRQIGDPSWLINPWVADATVSAQTTYRQSLSRAIVGDHLLTHLFAGARQLLEKGNQALSSVECPLCHLSADCCGPGHCAFQRPISRFNIHQTDLTPMVADAIAALPDDKRRLYR